MPCPEAGCRCQFTPESFYHVHNLSAQGTCVCGHASYSHTGEIRLTKGEEAQMQVEVVVLEGEGETQNPRALV